MESVEISLGKQPHDFSSVGKFSMDSSSDLDMSTIEQFVQIKYEKKEKN